MSPGAPFYQLTLYPGDDSKLVHGDDSFFTATLYTIVSMHEFYSTTRLCVGSSIVSRILLYERCCSTYYL